MLGTQCSSNQILREEGISAGKAPSGCFSYGILHAEVTSGWAVARRELNPEMGWCLRENGNKSGSESKAELPEVCHGHGRDILEN